jgi:hypothetical protein
MMKLSTMFKVDSTVDTQWQSRIAERILVLRRKRKTHQRDFEVSFLCSHLLQ